MNTSSSTGGPAPAPVELLHELVTEAIWWLPLLPSLLQVVARARSGRQPARVSAYTQRKSTLLPSHQDLAYFLFFPGQTCFPHRQHKGSSSSTASYVMGETHMNENEEARVERTNGTRRAHPSWRRKQSNSEFSIARPHVR